MSESMVRSYVLAIEKILNKKLLGIDLIVDAEDPSLVHCIDINLFPSYTGFPNVSEVMARFIMIAIGKCRVCCQRIWCAQSFGSIVLFCLQILFVIPIMTDTKSADPSIQKQKKRNILWLSISFAFVYFGTHYSGMLLNRY